MATRKRGLPDGYKPKLNLDLLTSDNNEDFLDAFDPDVAVPSKKKVEKRPRKAKREEPQPEKPQKSPEPRAQRSAPKKRPQEEGTPAERREVSPPVEEETSAGRYQSSSEEPNTKRRPPRIDIGFPPALKKAVDELRGDAIAKSGEPGLTRTDIINACTRCIERTVGRINYSRVGPRGHYMSQSSKAMERELEEAFFTAIGLHFVEHCTDQIPDRLLERCHQLYQQRMSAGTGESDDFLNLSSAEG